MLAIPTEVRVNGDAFTEAHAQLQMLGANGEHILPINASSQRDFNSFTGREGVTSTYMKILYRDEAPERLVLEDETSNEPESSEQHQMAI